MVPRTPNHPLSSASLVRPLQGATIALQGLFGLVLFASAGCRTPEEYRIEADEEVYRILLERRAAFTADPSGFTVDAPPDSLRERLLRGEVPEDALDLARCIEIAAENSRAYQDRRESLYLEALDLTFERWVFTVQENGSLAGLFDVGGDLDSSVDLSATAGLSRLLGTGAQVVSDIGLSLFKAVGSGGSGTLTSDLSLSITQPLLAGYGESIVLEPLTQAERDVIYEVRTYERFRRTFAVDVANRYFRILQQGDTLANEEANFERLKELRERNEALAEAGQLSEIQADQARQDELRASSRVISARQQLESLLDDFKFFLGLPIEAPLELDRSELDELRERGLEPVAVTEGEVLAFGVAQRLDFLTVVDRVADAERRVEVAADALQADLDVTLAASSTSDDGQPFDHDLGGVDWDLDVIAGLPLERLPERNLYRAALLGLEAARRAAEEFGDGIRADLRDSLRNLASLRESYLIQQNSVALAKQRVESSSLSLEAGRAETRDLLEAQGDLVEAQNAETAALVDYYLSSLSLYRDMESLRVDGDGLSVAPVPTAGAAGVEPQPGD